MFPLDRLLSPLAQIALASHKPKPRDPDHAREREKVPAEINALGPSAVLDCTLSGKQVTGCVAFVATWEHPASAGRKEGEMPQRWSRQSSTEPFSMVTQHTTNQLTLPSTPQSASLFLVFSSSYC